MKRKLLFILASFLIIFGKTAIVNGQVPQSIPYQAVARDANGNLIAMQTVAVKFTIHDITAGGASVYSEVQHPTTNALGLFSLNVGLITPASFALINWGTGAKFLQVEIDVANGVVFSDMGTQQMMSVPYALYAGSAPGVTSVGAISGTSNANGAAISGNALTLTPADGSNGGVVTTGTQTFAGAKTFSSAIKITGGSPGAGKFLTSDAVGLASWTTPASYWQTTGNAGTLPASNFIGSTDNVDVVFRTNNLESFRVTNAQKILFGITTPTAPGTQKVEVSSGTGDAIYGHSNSAGGWLGYETNFTAGTAGTIQGAGVWSSNSVAGYCASYAQSSGAATQAANMNYSNVWTASHNLVDNSSSINQPNAVFGLLNITNATLGGYHIAISGYSNRATTAGNPGYTVGVSGVGDTQNEDAYGLYGAVYTNSTTRAGGYFESFDYNGVSQAIAYVGTTFGGIARKITGTNAVSEIIPTPNHGRILLTCPESPEYWYQDYGSVKLVNGKAHVDLDPILADVVVIDANNPIRVFCTPVNMLYFNGVTILNQTPTGFDLVELNGGANSGTLDYQIVVRPKTDYGAGRFPQAPGPAYVKSDKEPAAAKAKNNPKDGRTIFYWPPETETYHYKPEDMVGVGAEVPAGPNRGKIKMADGTFKEFPKGTKPDLSK